MNRTRGWNRWVVIGALTGAVIVGLGMALSACARPAAPLPVSDPELRRSSEALAVSLSRRRDLSAGPIEYYRAEAWDDQLFAPVESDEQLAVVAWGPTETLPIEMARPVVYVVFSQPMTALAAVEETRSGPLSISPALPGRLRWLGSRTLSFEPDAPITGARSFTVTVPADAATLGGRSLGAEFSFRFATPELDIIDFYPGTPDEAYPWGDSEVPPSAAETLTVVLNHEPDPRELSRHLQLRANGRPVEFTLSVASDRATGDQTTGDRARAALASRTVLLNVAEPLPEDSGITVGLAAGARAAADQVGRAEATERAFHTITPFVPVSRREPVWGFPRRTGPDDRAVFLAFSHPVDPDSVAANLRLPIPGADPANHIEVWDRFVRVNGLPLEYEQKYSFTLGAGLSDVHGRRLSESVTLEIPVPALPRFWHLPDQGPRMLEAQFPPAVAWTHQNVAGGLFHIERVEDPYESMPASRLRPIDLSATPRNQRAVKLIDLRPWLSSAGTGFVRMAWNLAEPDSRGARPTWQQHDTMLQVTDLGITTRIGYNRVLVWVRSLSSGQPVAGAAVSLVDAGMRAQRRAATDSDGLAVIQLAPGAYRALFPMARGETVRVLVEHQGDRAMLRPNWSHDPYVHGVWNNTAPEQIESVQRPPLLFTDRGLYRPGEEIAIRGVDRTWISGRYRPYTGAFELSVEDLSGGSGEPIEQVRGTTSAQGGFWHRFRLPENAPPGYYQISYVRDGMRHAAYFQIAFFRPAAFSLSLSTQGASTAVRGDTLAVTARADYLSGGPVGNAETTVGWFRQPVEIELSAPETEGYRFGPALYYDFRVLDSSATRLDGEGRAVLTWATADEAERDEATDPTAGFSAWGGETATGDGAVRPGTAYRYETEVRVLDAANQEISAATSLLVYPSRRLLGARLASRTGDATVHFVEAGTEARADLVLFDTASGGIASTRSEVAVELIRHSWRVSHQRSAWGRVRTQYEPVGETVWSGTTELMNGRGSLSIPVTQAGMHTLRFTGRDSDGRLMVTDLSFYGTAAEWVRWAAEDPTAITLVPDRERYHPGDTARILVQSPRPEGHYLLTTERDGILDHRLIGLEGSANVIEIPITDEHVPVIYVALSASRPRIADPTPYGTEDLGKPTGYFGIVALAVSPDKHVLDIDTRYDKEEYRPGDLATVTIRVSHNGRPVRGAELTYLAADRGVLDLLNHRVPDPVTHFFSPDRFPLGVIGSDSRSMLIDPVLFDVTSLAGGDAGKGDEAATVREDFNPLAVFEPALITDASGTVTLRFVFPDNLTTYRASILAASDDRFGLREDELLVTQPIAVRAAVPRRIRERDSVEAGVLITNTTGRDQRVTVLVESAGPQLVVHGSDRRTVTVSPGVGTTVRFGIAAARAGAGTVRFRIEADDFRETLVAAIPVERPMVSEAVTAVGAVREAAATETVVIPAFLPDGEGSLELQLGTSRASDLGPAIRVLREGRRELLDQRMNALLPQLLFGERLAEDDDPVVVLTAIAALQNRDGGVPWSDMGRNEASSPWTTLRFAHLLSLAEARGIERAAIAAPGFDPAALNRFLLAIANREQMPSFLQAYALWMLAEREVSVAAQHAARSRDLEQQSNATVAMLALAGYALLDGKAGEPPAAVRTDVERLVRTLSNRTRIETRTIDLIEPFAQRFPFDSQVTALALMQMVQIRAGADDETVQRIANTLSARRRHGHWAGGADTAWALLAGSALVDAEGAATANLSTNVELGGRSIHESLIEGMETITRRFPFPEPPLADLARNQPLSLRFQAEGSGILFFAATLRYALPQEALLARDHGLSVVREVMDLDGNRVDPEQLLAGRTYRMRVTVSSPARHTMIALSMPIPSGAELLDPGFAVTGGFRETGGVMTERWERESAFGAQETVVAEGVLEIGVLGARFSAFAPVRRAYDGELVLIYPELYAGRRTVEFLFRAVTPGIFPTPPVVAAGIYTPELFGRSAGTLFRIAERR
ncbi:MAG: hypothetical protein EA403_11760 [Spirochaetaceae bacterium]|nr:MAG: hypothetical protein EA403_11760 [Spirochaetaceae bacterium]